jgi:hypothetical protein
MMADCMFEAAEEEQTVSTVSEGSISGLQCPLSGCDSRRGIGAARGHT